MRSLVIPFLASILLLAPAALGLAAEGLSSDGVPTFEREVVPLLKAHCRHCHGEQPELAGGLDLRLRRLIVQGGESGPAIVPGSSDASRLMELVSSGEMPPGDQKRLRPEELALLRRWIDAGAPTVAPEPEHVPPPGEPFLTPAELDHWSLRPLVRPTLPRTSLETMGQVENIPPDEVSRPTAGGAPAAAISAPAAYANPIDVFIAARLQQQGLSFSPEADRRTLVRRLYFDLLGLPPSPEEIERFLADQAPDAWERLVERLLASPHYGERWARHWLDVVHFGETHGYDKDKLREHAWPYRDYVIRAFNNDKPYGRFVEEQIAGDVLYPATVDGIEALGFLAAGPWDFIGHAEVPESKIDGKIARHLDRDDMVQTTITTFLSLTIGCAQCHDHKFDPIPQADYYSLQAVFAALDRADRPYDLDPQVSQRRTELLAEQRRVDRELEAVTTSIRERCGSELADLDRQIAAAEKPASPPHEHGYHSALSPAPDAVKWVQIDLGEPTEVCSVRLLPCSDDFNGIGAGFGFPLRYRIEGSDDPTFASGVVTLVDQTAADVPNPRLVPQTFQLSPQPIRYLRLTATRLALRKDDYILALAELEALDGSGRNVARGKPVTALDSIEASVRWRRSNLVDGLYPDSRPDADGLRQLRERRARLLQERVEAGELDRQQRLTEARRTLQQQLASLPPAQLAYVGTVHYGQGNFRGTGPDGARPRPIHLLARGDVTRPGREAAPGALSCLPQLAARFELPPDAPEGARRAALARWLTDPAQPLLWRSIVNRVWQYHFGRGIVETPGDFGRMGATPTHPELLDWLAAELRDGPQSLKDLHRLIVTSRTWRQTSLSGSASPPPRGASIDPENRWYWRMNRRQLDAEGVRDALLAVAGRLDTQMEGPSFRDFVIEHPEHSPHYEYHLHDPDDPRSHRRAVYRFLVRSQTQPFMTVLDCADPSMLVDRRSETVSPLQALTLLNSGLSLTMSRHLAERLRSECDVDVAPRDRLPLQLARGFQLAVGRVPAPEELAALVTYAEQEGLENSCRVLFNLNEFLFVD